MYLPDLYQEFRKFIFAFIIACFPISIFKAIIIYSQCESKFLTLMWEDLIHCIAFVLVAGCLLMIKFSRTDTMGKRKSYAFMLKMIFCSIWFSFVLFVCLYNAAQSFDFALRGVNVIYHKFPRGAPWMYVQLLIRKFYEEKGPKLPQNVTLHHVLYYFEVISGFNFVVGVAWASLSAITFLVILHAGRVFCYIVAHRPYKGSMTTSGGELGETEMSDVVCVSFRRTASRMHLGKAIPAQPSPAPVPQRKPLMPSRDQSSPSRSVGIGSDSDPNYTVMGPEFEDVDLTSETDDELDYLSGKEEQQEQVNPPKQPKVHFNENRPTKIYVI